MTIGGFEQIVANYYDQIAQSEWERMDRHRTEFAVTLKVLQDHLPPFPARVLDCGGGSGGVVKIHA